MGQRDSQTIVVDGQAIPVAGQAIPVDGQAIPRIVTYPSKIGNCASCTHDGESSIV